MVARRNLHILCVVFGLWKSVRSQKPLTCSWTEDDERDPALELMKYDVGDGPQETWVYVEPDITSFYQGDAPANTKVTPVFKGFQGKFINLGRDTVDLWWEATLGGTKHIMRRHQGFTASGTATFPGHSFVFTPIDDKEKILTRLIVKSYPENLYVYDPYIVEGDPQQTAANLEVLSTDDRAKYEHWRKTLSFHEQYRNFTGRSYLANYLRDPPMHFMWRADYFGQTHWVETRETHFKTVPEDKSLLEPILSHGSKRELKDSEPRMLHEYRDGASTMNLTLKVLSCAPRAFEIENFLSRQEVEHIVQLASGVDLKLSSTGDITGHKETPKELQTDSRRTRTSYNSWVPREKSPIIDAIYRRAADVMRIDEALLRHRSDHTEWTNLTSTKPLAEQLQLVHYGPGQEYTAHHDFGFSRIDDQFQGARFGTLLLYLNEGMAGGETSFPRWSNAETFHELSIKPEVGKAVLFYSQLPDGNLDDLSHHAAKPVTDGEKWLINLWTWDPIYD
jgi:prolyl 4-hydroxylase